MVTNLCALRWQFILELPFGHFWNCSHECLAICHFFGLFKWLKKHCLFRPDSAKFEQNILHSIKFIKLKLLIKNIALNWAFIIFLGIFSFLWLVITKFDHFNFLIWQARLIWLGVDFKKHVKKVSNVCISSFRQNPRISIFVSGYQNFVIVKYVDFFSFCFLSSKIFIKVISAYVNVCSPLSI